MGLLDFVKDAGRNVGLFGGRKAAEAEKAKEEAAAASRGANAATDPTQMESMRQAMIATDIKAAILSYVAIRDLGVTYDGNRVTLIGIAPTQTDREKAVLVAGNTGGVGQVDDRLGVDVPEAPARYHTVASGDTLGEIAKRYYGDAKRYNEIFDANRPMLDHPDRIYPGQVLRIPSGTPVTS